MQLGSDKEVEVKRSMVVLGVMALVLSLAGPAMAKGAIPQSAQMTGPGLDKPITFGKGIGGSSPDGDVNTLATNTKLFDALFGGNLQGTPPIPDKLGPRYTITWTMFREFGENKTFTVRSDLYPYAKGGGLMHTFGGQKVHEGNSTLVFRSGWTATNPVTIANLRAWGLPKDPRRTAGPVASSAIAPVWTIALAVVALVGAAIVGMRRKGSAAATG
jgi:hypothetical protein